VSQYNPFSDNQNSMASNSHDVSPLEPTSSAASVNGAEHALTKGAGTRSLLRFLQGQEGLPDRDCAGCDSVDEKTENFLSGLAPADIAWLRANYQHAIEGWPAVSRLMEMLSRRTPQDLHFGPLVSGSPFAI
jgi:hypothetical protein